MTAARPSGIFPLAYFEGFLRYLSRHPQIEVITYADLDWQNDYAFTGNYPDEWARWSTQHSNSDTIFVMLQHDVDVRPERTMRVLALEDELDLQSAVMVFNRRHDRKRLLKEGTVAYVDYDVDWRELSRLERERGFIVGYHANAYEQAGWDGERGLTRFQEDVSELRKTFTIDYFSPHGGVPSPINGTNNVHLGIPPSLRRGLRWVANRHTVKCHGYYSDGGISNVKRDLARRDLRDFVRSWLPGCRYRVLTHPQYYGEPRGQPDHFFEAEWYANLFTADTDDPDSYWADVELGSRLRARHRGST